VIDPKGDIANLLLTFPNLTPEEFRPWVDEGQASREGVSPEEFATMEADKWKEGLASWGQTPERIQMLRDTVEMRIYTPGSNNGRPLTILKSFSAPSEEIINDNDAFFDRISSATSGLLALMSIDADPINSREHILISKILETAWRDGKDLDLGKLIGHIQKPPFARVGIMELDSFYPAKDRQTLAMTMNNLLASPSFAGWLEGEALDVKKMLHNDDGKPCVSIVSIAHLSDQERMFFVTILLNEMISWMRTQAGTSSLRALLYMDEVFGYFPPTKNPPSKQPMLTLMKQARAFGLGVVLATQNPVDLNVHEDGPVVFETRWAMSYLRGPLTRNQIQDLVQADTNYDPAAIAQASTKSRSAARVEQAPAPKVDQRQLIPDSIPQFFAEPNQHISGADRLVYRPALLATGRLHFVRVSYKVDEWKEVTCLASISGGEMPNEVWENAEEIQERLSLDNEPIESAEFDAVPDDLQTSKNFKTWKNGYEDFLYRDKAATIWKCGKLKKYSEPNETLGDFKVRLEQHVSELRDEAVEKLRKKYGKKFDTLRSQIRRAEDKIDVEKEQYQQQKMASRISIGSTIMGALFGRRTTRSAGTAMRSFSRSSKEKNDIERAEGNLEELQYKYEDLEKELNDEVAEVEEKLSVDELEYDEMTLPPRKSDLSVQEFGIVWLPLKISSTGIAEAVY